MARDAVDDDAEWAPSAAMKRADMRRIRERLRLHHEYGLAHRAISAATGLSKGSSFDYPRRAHAAGVTWESARELDDAEIEAKLFAEPTRNLPPDRTQIDFEWVRRELTERRQAPADHGSPKAGSSAG